MYIYIMAGPKTPSVENRGTREVHAKYIGKSLSNSGRRKHGGGGVGKLQ